METSIDQVFMEKLFKACAKRAHKREFDETFREQAFQIQGVNQSFTYGVATGPASQFCNATEYVRSIRERLRAPLTDRRAEGITETIESFCCNINAACPVQLRVMPIGIAVPHLLRSASGLDVKVTQIGRTEVIDRSSLHREAFLSPAIIIPLEKLFPEWFRLTRSITGRGPGVGGTAGFPQRQNNLGPEEPKNPEDGNCGTFITQDPQFDGDRVIYFNDAVLVLTRVIRRMIRPGRSHYDVQRHLFYFDCDDGNCSATFQNRCTPQEYMNIPKMKNQLEQFIAYAD